MSDEMSATVVVGFDGSDLSIKALAWADRYAGVSGGGLRVVTAWQWATAYGAPMMFEGYSPEADALVIAEKARASTTVPADRVEVVASEGQPGPVLVAASEGAQALVVGSQGHSGVSKVLLGSVSSYCAHHAECPVVIVR